MRLNVPGTAINWPLRFLELQSSCQNKTVAGYYQSALPAMDTPLDEIRFLAMDFETTGLDLHNDDIISIGVVPFTLQRVYLNQAKHWMVKPKQVLSEDSVVIHGITHSDLNKAPDIIMLLDELLQQLAGHVMVVHYRWIEREFLNKTLMQRIGQGIEFPLIDTLELEALIQHAYAGGFINKLRGRKKQSLRLAKSRSRYGLPPYTPHHALTDAIATAELFQAQVAYHFNNQQPISDLWL